MCLPYRPTEGFEPLVFAGFKTLLMSHARSNGALVGIRGPLAELNIFSAENAALGGGRRYRVSVSAGVAHARRAQVAVALVNWETRFGS